MAQYAIGQIELAPAVPETTLQAFERLCALFAYGILCYDLYTVAGDLARMVTEQALRERFLPFYGGRLRLPAPATSARSRSPQTGGKPSPGGCFRTASGC